MTTNPPEDEGPGPAPRKEGSSLSKLLLPQTLGLNAFLALAFIAAATRWNVSLVTVILILLAFIGARNAGHAFNQIADRRYDTLNPRTADRPLVTGSMSVHTAEVVVGVNVALLFVCAWLLNILVLLLAPIALVLVLGYSFAKRFTAWTTVMLGLVQSMVCAGVYLATWEGLPLVAIAGSAAVLFFGTAFESVHSLGDMDSDARLGLRSLPLLLGPRRSVAAVAAFLACSMALFGVFGYLAAFGTGFYVALLFMCIVCGWEVSSLWSWAGRLTPGRPGRDILTGGLEGGGIPFVANLVIGALFFTGVMLGIFVHL
jgi:4-hydroxybenzoate polyprenyltransferase